MIALIQRVKRASVKVDDVIIGEISKGLLVYIGFEIEDTVEKNEWVLNKILNLRMFSDEQNKMNLSIKDASGELLVISNFTLPADLNDSGRRPSFSKSAKPEIAMSLYDDFIQQCKTMNIKTEQGHFGAMMDVESIADGPVNFLLKK